MEQRDKDLPDIIKDLGVKDTDRERLTRKGILLPGDDARQEGMKCRDCGSRKPVYYISNPLGSLFPAGAYCYACLLKRCRATKIIPCPIPLDLLNKLKLDMRIAQNANPKYITT